MKNLSKASAIATLLMLSVSPCSYAQTSADSFTGLAVGLNAVASHNKVDYSGFLNAAPSKTDAAVQLDGSYGFNLAPRWVINVGATYDLNKTDFGSTSYVDGGSTYAVAAKLKNHYSLYAAPGFRLSPTLLAYGKLAWHSARSEISDGQLGTISNTHHGIGYGVGVASMLAQQVEARFEVQRVNLSREAGGLSSGKPSMTQALVSAAYRF